MKCAKELALLGRLPAFGVLASVDPKHGRLILSKVEVLPRMNMLSRSLLEILIGNDSIIILIKLLKDLIESLITYMDTPMVKVPLQFLCL